MKPTKDSLSELEQLRLDLLTLTLRRDSVIALQQAVCSLLRRTFGAGDKEAPNLKAIDRHIFTLEHITKTVSTIVDELPIDQVKRIAKLAITDKFETTVKNLAKFVGHNESFFKITARVLVTYTEDSFAQNYDETIDVVRKKIIQLEATPKN